MHVTCAVCLRRSHPLVADELAGFSNAIVVAFLLTGNTANSSTPKNLFLLSGPQAYAISREVEVDAPQVDTATLNELVTATFFVNGARS